MSSLESQISAPHKGTDSHAEQASSHLRQDASSPSGNLPPHGDTVHNTAAPHLPAVQLHDGGHPDSGIMANVGKAASQFWQGAAGEVKDHNKNVQHSGEIGLAVGVGTGLAIAGAATLGILALPEVLVVGGVAVAAGAAISSLAGVYESSHSYTTGKDASPMKHAGAVATDMAVAATGGAVGAAVGAYGAMAAGELAVQSFMSGL